jgi:transposase-like protein
LSVVEQRYHAVMEVAAGARVTQVAARYGVLRQAMHSWTPPADGDRRCR